MSETTFVVLVFWLSTVCLSMAAGAYLMRWALSYMNKHEPEWLERQRWWKRD